LAPQPLAHHCLAQVEQGQRQAKASDDEILVLTVYNHTILIVRRSCQYNGGTPRAAM
jgi:hypothetical protein